MPERKQRPYLFLFDGNVDGLPNSPLLLFTRKFLEAISLTDPKGTLCTGLKGGLPTISGYAEKVTEVRANEKSRGLRISYDMGIYRTMVWDLADSLCGGHCSAGFDEIFDVLRSRTYECLSVSDIPKNIAEAIDQTLSTVAGYIGFYQMDPGNPLQLRAFSLGSFGGIKEGFVIQERSIEDEEVYDIQGAKEFKPNGIKWVPHTYGFGIPEFQLKETKLSIRGQLSKERLERKTSVDVEERIFRAINQASWTDSNKTTYKFSTMGETPDILQAILPEGKFTKYLFNPEHKKGGGKAKFLIETLEFEPEDWRFLAAQFYDGLLLSEPTDLEIRKWGSGYGAKFDNLVKVTSRTGKSGILRTGWMLEPGNPPKLSTALPGPKDAIAVEPLRPDILRPGPYNSDWYSALYSLAHARGLKAFDLHLPTPMAIEGYSGVIESGEYGSSGVRIHDARKGMARWAITQRKAYKYYSGGAYFSCPVHSLSAGKEEAYARAFAKVLALNGIVSTVETYLS